MQISWCFDEMVVSFFSPLNSSSLASNAFSNISEILTTNQNDRVSSSVLAQL